MCKMKKKRIQSTLEQRNIFVFVCYFFSFFALLMMRSVKKLKLNNEMGHFECRERKKMSRQLQLTKVEFGQSFYKIIDMNAPTASDIAIESLLRAFCSEFNGVTLRFFKTVNFLFLWILTVLCYLLRTTMSASLEL